MRTNDYSYKLRRRRNRKERNIKSAVIGLLIERPLHECLGHYSDNRAPRLWLGRIVRADPAANGTVVSKVFLCEGRGDNGDRVLGVVVIQSKVAALEASQTQRAEGAIRTPLRVT